MVFHVIFLILAFISVGVGVCVRIRGQICAQRTCGANRTSSVVSIAHDNETRAAYVASALKKGPNSGGENEH